MIPKALPKSLLILRKPLYRVLLSLVITLLAFLIFRNSIYNFLVLAIVLWDIFALSYLVFGWIIFFTNKISHIKDEARKEDGSRMFVFAIILLSSFVGLSTVLLLMLSKDWANLSMSFYLAIVISAILLSWSMVHTTFSFHYAKMFYDADKKDEKKHAGGLDFPNEEAPDYLDFAYFSFVIGMTFQVSDVTISSSSIRRVVLGHSLIAFALNTFVVALTINIIAGLIK